MEVILIAAALAWLAWRMLRAYDPPVCARCQHLIAEHRSGRSLGSHCRRAHCGCRQYVPTTTRSS